MDLAIKFIGFLATAYLARVLGKSGFGAISVGLSVLNYALVLSNAGLSLYGTRKIASNPGETGITSEILSARMVLTVFIFLLTFCITLLLLGFSETGYIIIAYLLYMFAASVMLEWFFVGIQKMGIVSFAKIAGTAVYLVLLFFLIHEREDALLTGFAWTFGGLVSSFILFYSFHRLGFTFRINLTKADVIKVIKSAFPLGAASYISQFLVAFPVIYIAYIAGNPEAGLFSAAFKIISFFLILDRVFVTIFLPKITMVIANKESSLEEIFNKTLKVIVFPALSAFMILFMFSDKIIITVFGTDYTGAILIFKLLLIYFLFTIINSVFANTLIGMMKEKIYTFSLIIALGFFFILTFLFKPFIGYYAVIYSFIIIDIISLAYLINHLNKEIDINIFRNIIIPVLYSGVSVFLLVIIPAAYYLKIVLLVVILIPVLSIIIDFGKNEIDFLKRVLL
jgi:O-antigen/teichoic acid export membrane protein